MPEEEFLTIPEAAHELSVGAPALHNAMKGGRLPFAFIYGRKLIRRADLDAYKLRTRPGGEKPKGRPPGAKNKLRGLQSSTGLEAVKEDASQEGHK